MTPLQHAHIMLWWRWVMLTDDRASSKCESACKYLGAQIERTRNGTDDAFPLALARDVG